MSDHHVWLTMIAFGVTAGVLLLALMAVCFWLGQKDGHRTKKRDAGLIQAYRLTVRRQHAVALAAGVPLADLERIVHDLDVVEEEPFQATEVRRGRHARGGHDE